MPLRPVCFLPLTGVYSHRPRCTLQVSFTALQPFLLWLTSLHSGVQRALSPCGQPLITPNPRDVPSPGHQRPNRGLIQEESLPSTFSAIPLYTTMPGECLGTTNIPPPPATAYSLTRGSKSVSPMVSHKHIKWPLSSRILTPTVGYHHQHHIHLSPLCDLRSSTARNNSHLLNLAIPSKI